MSAQTLDLDTLVLHRHALPLVARSLPAPAPAQTRPLSCQQVRPQPRCYFLLYALRPQAQDRLPAWPAAPPGETAAAVAAAEAAAADRHGAKPLLQKQGQDLPRRGQPAAMAWAAAAAAA